MRDRGDLIWGLMVASICINNTYSVDKPSYTSKNINNEIQDFIADFAAINFRLFSKESVLVFSATAPLYAAARSADEKLYSSLYNHTNHTNTFNIGRCRNFLAEDIGIALPLIAIGGGLWISHNSENRIIGRNLIAGLGAFNCARIILKETLNGSYCYRPYSGCFDKRLVRGGFPSGHTGALVYATMVLAIHKGALWAIPMGIYSATIISSLLICNYHYLSQVVAGGALGALYAVATSGVINRRLGEHFEIEPTVGKNGTLGLSLSYSF